MSSDAAENSIISPLFAASYPKKKLGFSAVLNLIVSERGPNSCLEGEGSVPHVTSLRAVFKT